MPIYSGEVKTQELFSRQDHSAEILAKIPFTAALLVGDKLSFEPKGFEGKKLFIEGFEIQGDNPDTDATPTLELIAGTDDDNDGLLEQTVVNAGDLNLNGKGALIGATITDQTKVELRVQVAPATAAASGEVIVKLKARAQMK